jgi:hypothetical protein
MVQILLTNGKSYLIRVPAVMRYNTVMKEGWYGNS